MKVLIHEHEHSLPGVAVAREDDAIAVVVTTATTPDMATRLVRSLTSLDERDAIHAAAADRFPGVASDQPLPPL